jgi:amino acid transporter
LVVVATGLIAMAIAVNYSYLATIFPAAGSAYAFLSRTYRNRLIGFVFTWSKWLGYMAADAVLAIGFGNYLQLFYPAVDPTLAGVGLLTVLFVINLLWIRRYSRSQNALFLLLLLTIFVLVIPGSLHVRIERYRPFFTGGFHRTLTAAVPLFYAYLGIAVAGQIGAEVKDPARNLPLAMIGGTAALILLYTCTAIVIYGVADYTVLANSARPLATAATMFLPFSASAIVAVGGLLATATSVHAVMAASIKLPYAWGWDGIFPQWFAEVNERWRTPHWSLTTLYVVAVGLTVWSEGLDRVGAITVFSYLLAYLAVSLTTGYVYVSRRDLSERAAFDPGLWMTVPVGIGSIGSLVMLAEAYQGSLSVYLPWLFLGTALFVGFWYRGKQQGTDVQAILDTLPGVPTSEYTPELGPMER